MLADIGVQEKDSIMVSTAHPSFLDIYIIRFKSNYLPLTSWDFTIVLGSRTSERPSSTSHNEARKSSREREIKVYCPLLFLS